MSRNIVIDPHLDSYRTFFDHGWARQMMELAEGSVLDGPVFDLCVAWRGAANTHYLPWLMMESMKSFAEGLSLTHEPLGAKLLAAMKLRLSAEMGDSLRLMQRQQLDQAIQRIGTEVQAALEKERVEFDTEFMWQRYLDNSEFQFSLWGSQRLCYGAVYYAYEDFLLRTYKLAMGQAAYQIRRDDFSKDFGTAFGVSLRDYCWSDPAVHVARLTRHALVHNGGRVTDKLSRQKHNLRVEGGELQIMPSDTKALFDLLKDRAFSLTKEVIGRLSTGAET
jgi:hypothetical protein